MNATKNTSWFKALAAACAATLMASGVHGEVTWQLTDTSATLSGSGTYTLSTEPTLSSLTLLSSSDVLLQGEGLFFQPSARVSLDKAVSCQLALPLSVAGDLAFLRTDANVISSCNEACLPAGSSNPIVVLEDSCLEDWVILGGQGCGSSLSGYGTAKHIERGEGWCIAQIQVPTSEHLKCVKVRLEQRGDDVVGYIVYAKYVTLTTQDVDFDTQGTSYSIATAETASGYGMKQLEFLRVCYAQDSVVTVTKKVALSDAKATFKVGYGTTLRSDGNGLMSQDGAFPPVLDLNGILEVTNNMSIAFTNTIIGTNGTLRTGGMSIEIHQVTNEVRYVAPMPTTWTTVATNSFLDTLTNVYINAFSGLAIPTTPSQNIQYLRSTNGYTVGQCQQVAGSYSKCVYIEFIQENTNILARIPKAYYSRAPLGTDYDTLAETTSDPDATHKKSYTVGSNPKGYNYGVGDITMFFDVTRTGIQDSFKTMHMQYAGANKAIGMTIEQYGGIAEVTHKSGLPVSGTYRVVGGELTVSAAGCDNSHGVSDGGTAIYVENGGTLVQGAAAVFDRARQVLCLDASTLQLKVLSTSGGRANCYINNLTFSNGSVGQGAIPGVCYGANATWRVTGSSASVFKNSIVMASGSANNFTVEVADVTQDDSVDFTIKGGVFDYDGNHGHCTLVKKGAGTLAIQGTSYWRMPARVVEGVLRFDSSTAFKQVSNTTNGFVLAGGTLAFAAGTANAAGPIALEKASALVLGEGASVSFADSTAKTWADGATLTITGPEVRNHTRTGVRIGTAQTLTGKRRAALRYNGVRVRQDAEGYLQPDKTPFVLILR